MFKYLFFFLLVCLCWFFTSHQQSFSYVRTSLPGLNKYNARINVLTQGHITVTRVRLEHAASWSQVKHSTIEPLRSHRVKYWMLFFQYLFSSTNTICPFLSVISDFQVSMHIPSGLSLRSSGWEVLNAARSLEICIKYKKIRSYFCPQLLSVSFYYIIARLCTGTISYEPSLLGIVLNRVWSSAVFRPWTFPVWNNVWCTVISRSQYTVYCVLLLYVPSQQLWSLRDGQFT